MSEAQLFASMTFPEIYERVLVQPLFRPFADELVARLKPTQGDSLIDVACGTGIVARIARQRLGPTARIVAVIGPSRMRRLQILRPCGLPARFAAIAWPGLRMTARGSSR